MSKCYSVKYTYFNIIYVFNCIKLMYILLFNGIIKFKNRLHKYLFEYYVYIMHFKWRDENILKKYVNLTLDFSLTL